ncbi:hypothetical protein [Chitinophaga tropicalis]|uniref:Uncharacterized protein n=1 Tax=Chitinophaga tropicalis TaxID=2683588 RepID=A0A7K1U4L6_9BACT|nr:hypothetical protein [Chitinophaga tropicalis]MVT09303.1 hypothetical protein [Chitinophaga tropicalis]
MKKRPAFAFLVFLLVGINVQAQVWQWSVPVKGARKDGSTAYLWIPETVRKVKAVILAQHNMEEISIIENAHFRKEMEKLSFAIVWVAPSFDHFFRFNEGAGQVLDSFMSALADSSGYSELKYVPFVTVGHSAAASWPYYYTAWNPGRTLCAISVSGQWPWFRHPQFAPDIWEGRNIDYVPCLETMGEYEAADTWSAEGLKERKEHPLMPLSMLACPGEGHFAATDKKIAYIAYYIKKAAQYRLPENFTAGTVLKAIDPVRTGWLMEKWRADEAPHTRPAPVGSYRGDTTQAFWFFDEEMVRATERYQQQEGKKQPQLLGYMQDGAVIRQRNTHLQVHIPFHPLNDGVSFMLKGTFLDTVPGESERPPMWTGLPPGSSLSHAEKGGPIAINRVTGPFKKINDTTFRLDLRNGEAPHPKEYSLCFVATHPGDTAFKPAVQQAEMIVPARNTKGEPQQITFPPIGDKKAGIKRIKLQARSDKGLPVYYYIQSGPAYIKEGYLEFTPVPPRARFPVKVTVVAWQYGNSVVQTAEAVQRLFYLYKCEKVVR